MKRKQQLAELRGSDGRELRVRYNDLRKEGFNLKFHAAAEGVAKTARFRQIRRETARILTVLAEKGRKAAGGES